MSTALLRLLATVVVANSGLSTALAQDAGAPGYEFSNGYPTVETVTRAYDDIDLNRAIQAYRFFYPGVSMLSSWKGNQALGMTPNQTFAILESGPEKQVLTANADTPYASMLLDLSNGPLVVEMPPGALISVINDINQNWVADLGLPGPDKGQGGKHLILPPGYQQVTPAGYHVGRAGTHKAILVLRALVRGGDVPAAIATMKEVKVYPLHSQGKQVALDWTIQTGKALDSMLLGAENGLGYWQLLHELVDSEPVPDSYRAYYGELAALGIAKGKPFAPDARMRNILERAAQAGNAQLRVQSLADRSPDRVVWPDRQWEWAVLRPQGGSFDKPDYIDLEAREKWFFQALASSPAMFRRAPGAGSLYWLGSRDSQGQFLDGGKSYRLRVPASVPARLFWSVTVYDSETRSQIRTEQMHAALRSQYELRDVAADQPVELYVGPEAPAGQEKRWIRTEPGKGWFAYFRIYGPQEAAFEGSWKPGDFEETRHSTVNLAR